MSELNKTQLTAENQSNFPNNNTGFITPTLLREFNQDMIDSLVDEQTYNVDSSSFSGSIASLENQVDALVLSGSGVAIQEEGSSLGAATTLNFVGASVTASLVGATATINVNATQTDLSGLNQFTASQESFNSSATASIVALQNFSSSLDATFATDAQLNASSSTLQGNINTKLNTSSFNSFTQSYNTFSSSVASEINSLQDVTGSYATTSSNTFIGNQTIDGNLTFPSGAFISTTNDSGGLYLSALNQGTLYLNGDGGEGDVVIGYNAWQNYLRITNDTQITGSLLVTEDIKSTGKIILKGKITSEITIIELGNLFGGIYLFSVGENLKQSFKIIKE